jgi:hypothetical protein
VRFFIVCFVVVWHIIGSIFPLTLSYYYHQQTHLPTNDFFLKRAKTYCFWSMGEWGKGSQTEDKVSYSGIRVYLKF